MLQWGILGSSVVPACLKMAVITQILKKPSHCVNALKNFCPVLNIPLLGKVIKKVVAAQLSSPLSAHGIHDPMQSVYRPGHSMETALLRIQDNINRGLDAGVGSLLVLLDLSAAFNTIDHTFLLERLEAVAGIQGAALAWLRSYLHDRMQSVIINGVQSTTADLSIGVPQGSVLGPLLFLVYVIPLRSVIERHPEARHHSYANDRELYIQFYPQDQDSHRHALQRLEMCVEEDRVWLLTNKVKLNSGKTGVHAWSSWLHTTRPPTKCCSRLWALVASACMQCPLSATSASSWTPPWTRMARSRASSAPCSITWAPSATSLIRRFLDRNTCVKAVLSLVMSRVDYCKSLLVGQSAAALRGLQLAQNYAARLVMGLRRSDHVTSALEALHWLPIHQRVCYELMCLLCRTLYTDDAPVYMSSVISHYTPGRALRSASPTMGLAVPRTRLACADRCFSESAPAFWNVLPPHLHQCSTLQTFKASLKTHLFRQHFS